jgi:integrase
MQEPKELSQRSWQPLLPDEFDQSAMTRAGKAANQAAARHRIADYRARRAEETLRRQTADLNLFAAFLTSAGAPPAGELDEDPAAWSGITWGLVEAFIKWQLQSGYAVASVNVRLSTIKTYARLAMQAGVVSTQEYALIRSVAGYSQKEQRRVDQRRELRRIGTKKASPVTISPEQAQALKTQPDTPQGRRDSLLMALLLDHGLRVGELAALVVEELEITKGLLRFYRPKVGKEQIHRLSPDTMRALQAYAACGDLPAAGPLLRRSLKDGSLGEAGVSERGLTQRVCVLGEELGIAGLSAHDCRHFWATSAARHGTDPFSLQEAGGWSSLAMPRRYVEDNQVANEKVKLE